MQIILKPHPRKKWRISSRKLPPAALSYQKSPPIEAGIWLEETTNNARPSSRATERVIKHVATAVIDSRAYTRVSIYVYPQSSLAPLAPRPLKSINVGSYICAPVPRLRTPHKPTSFPPRSMHACSRLFSRRRARLCFSFVCRSRTHEALEWWSTRACVCLSPFHIYIFFQEREGCWGTPPSIRTHSLFLFSTCLRPLFFSPFATALSSTFWLCILPCGVHLFRVFLPFFSALF